MQQLQAPRTAVHVRAAGTKDNKAAAPSLHLQPDSLGQKSSMGCSIPQAASKDKKREKGRACLKKKENKKETTSICKGGGKLLEGSGQ
jgi:hypothetical protein